MTKTEQERRISELVNPYLVAGRLRKCQALVAVVLGKINADEASQMTEEQWLITTMAARVNPPSVDTRAMVIEALRQAEAMATRGPSATGTDFPAEEECSTMGPPAWAEDTLAPRRMRR